MRDRTVSAEIGMNKPAHLDWDARDVMETTFHAISAAMGWDKEYPRVELWASVSARLNRANAETAGKFDEQLATKLNPAESTCGEGGV